MKIQQAIETLKVLGMFLWLLVKTILLISVLCWYARERWRALMLHTKRIKEGRCPECGGPAAK